MSIVREMAKGGLLTLGPRRIVRREGLYFSFVYDGVGPDETRVDPVWTPILCTSVFFGIMSTGAGGWWLALISDTAMPCMRPPQPS